MFLTRLSTSFKFLLASLSLMLAPSYSSLADTRFFSSSSIRFRSFAIGKSPWFLPVQRIAAVTGKWGLTGFPERSIKGSFVVYKFEHTFKIPSAWIFPDTRNSANAIASCSWVK